jgi:glutamate/tyrosine decarboxylase-like PLP-dependent enzyme
LASEQAHYTHKRISEVLGIPFAPVPVTADGCMDIAAVESLLENGDVGTVVATMGNTGLGAVDPLAGLMKLRKRHEFRIHADAAYGGYFGLASKLRAGTGEAFAAMSDVDSIVIDPHKHGLQPYGCGCVLFRDPEVGRFYKHGSPYTYFSSAELHLGEISLECSRPGASAVALWATQRLMPLVKHGEFAGDLDRCLLAARDFHARLTASPAFTPLMPPELDIVVYAANGPTASVASERARKIFDRAASRDLHLALIELPCSLAEPWLDGIDIDADSICCLRSVLMKPDHDAWTARIVEILEGVAAD